MDGRRTGIRLDVRGPAGEAGFLLLAPPSEMLDWDVQHEIASTSRYWMREHQAWWIAAPYRSTAESILVRFDPGTRSGWRFARPRLPALLRARLATLWSLGGSLRGSIDGV